LEKMKNESEFRRRRALAREGLLPQQRTKEGNIIIQAGGVILIKPGNGTISGKENAKLFPKTAPGRSNISRAAARKKRRDASGHWLPGSSTGKTRKEGRIVTSTRMRDEKRR
jgi:hypothetical protein